MAKNNNTAKFVAVLAVLRDNIEADFVKYSEGQEAQALRHLDALDLDGDRAVLVWGPGAQAPTPDYGRFTMWTGWGLDWSATWTKAEEAWEGDVLFQEAVRAAERICLPVKPW